VFTLDAEDPRIAESALGVAVHSVAGAAGPSVLKDDAVKADVVTPAFPSRARAGRYTDSRRVERRREFSAATPPYPSAGWLPIRSVERNGMATPDEMHEALDGALRGFFGPLKRLDPAVES